MIDLDKPENAIKTYILSLPIDEQELQIAIWINSPNIVNEMKMKTGNSTPSKVIEYNRFPQQTRITMNNEPYKYSAFWQDKEVRDYFDNRQSINNINHRNISQLRWAREILYKNHYSISKIDEAIGTYSGINNHPEPINMYSNKSQSLNNINSRNTTQDSHWQD